VENLGGPRNIVLDGNSPSPTAREKGFDAAFDRLLWPLVALVIIGALPRVHALTVGFVFNTAVLPPSALPCSCLLFVSRCVRSAQRMLQAATSPTSRRLRHTANLATGAYTASTAVSKQG